ncbi:MAG: hypothetical protein ACXABU_13280 [Candidatus Hodarchaeales archaeon]|jgi:hypothetical protein
MNADQKKKELSLPTNDPFLAAPVNPQYLSLTSEHTDTDLAGAELDFKDYIALFIALIQTVFLPLLIIMAILFLLSVFFHQFQSPA